MKPLGLRTAIFTVADLESVRDWYTEFLGHPPYYDQAPYVGFDVAGYELGLFQVQDAKAATPGAGATTAYWGFDDIDAAWARALELGAIEHEPIMDVGGDIRIGAVRDPFGNVFGLIDNPDFKAKGAG